MKKNIIIISEAVLLLLAVISLFGLYQDNRAKELTIQEQEHEISNLSYTLHQQENETSTSETANQIAFISSVFSYYLNYNEDNYQSRFKEVEPYFSLDVINKLRGAGISEPPTIPVKSSARNYITYVSPAEPDSFVHVTDVLYQVADNEPTTFKNVYTLHLIEGENEYGYVIDNVDVFSGTPTNE